MKVSVKLIILKIFKAIILKIFLLLTFAQYYVCTEQIEILDIQTNGYGNYVSANSTIHSNRSKFDLHFTIHRTLNTHDLIMNMKLKLKAEDKHLYRILYSWKRIDLCKFLTKYEEDKVFKYFFKSALESSSSVRCPLKEGSYSMHNFGLQSNMKSTLLPRGKYRFFFEIAQQSGEFAKMFCMQVNVMYYND